MTNMTTSFTSKGEQLISKLSTAVTINPPLSKGADQYGSKNIITCYKIINTKGQFQYI